MATHGCRAGHTHVPQPRAAIRHGTDLKSRGFCSHCHLPAPPAPPPALSAPPLPPAAGTPACVLARLPCCTPLSRSVPLGGQLCLAATCQVGAAHVAAAARRRQGAQAGSRLLALLLRQGGDRRRASFLHAAYMFILRILRQQMQQALADLGALQAHAAQQAAGEGIRDRHQKGGENKDQCWQVFICFQRSAVITVLPASAGCWHSALPCSRPHSATLSPGPHL